MLFEIKKQFVGADGKIFTIEDVTTIDEQLWVRYTNNKTGEKYSCLLEAFSERFILLENQE